MKIFSISKDNYTVEEISEDMKSQLLKLLGKIRQTSAIDGLGVVDFTFS